MATINSTPESEALKTMRSRYLLGSVIIWVGIILGLAVVLSGTNYFMQILPILTGGIVWFVILVPGALLTRPQRPAGETQSTGKREARR